MAACGIHFHPNAEAPGILCGLDYWRGQSHADDDDQCLSVFI